jgi:hypothetical protein
MTKPWAGRSKSAFDTALDIMVKVPAILEEFETVMCGDSVPETKERGRKLKERLWKLHTELLLWYDNFILLYGSTFVDHEGFELLIAGQGNPARQVDLPGVLAQHGVAPLYAMTMFWTGCAVVYEKTIQVEESFPGTSTRAPLSETSRLDLLKYCICLSRSTRLLQEPGAGLASSTLFTGTAVACVISNYVTNNKETETEGVREDMAELERGLEDIMARADSMWSQTWTACMDHMKRRHEQPFVRSGESTPRFWAGKHWYMAHIFPLRFAK